MRNFGYDGCDGQSVADAIVLETARIIAAEARRFVAVASFADVHSPSDDSATCLPGTEQSRLFGGDGTPDVLEFTNRELSPLIGRSPVSGSHQLRDALDVRHRHPLLWARVLDACTADAPDTDPALAAGMVEVWQARKIAQACHAADLTLDQARWVDTEITPLVGRLAWGTLLTALEERVVAADPDRAEARRADEQRRAYVAAGQCNEHGMKTLVAKAEAGDVIALLATLDLIADCLKSEGHDAPREVLRAKAVGILANPAEALTLLLRYALVDQAGAPSPDHPADHEGGVASPDDTVASDACPAMGSSEEPADPGEPAEPSSRSALPDELDLFGDRRIDPREADAGPPPGHHDHATARPGESSVPEPHPEPDGWMTHLGGPEMLTRLIDLLGRRLDLTKLTPKRVLYFHLNEASYRRDRNGVARFEGEQPLTYEHLRELLSGTRVTIKPVIDLENTRAVERYTVPDDLREAVRLVSPHSLFPWSTTSSSAEGVDDDHAVPYDPEADTDQPQTRLDNLGPLDRGSHRLKTHKAGWAMRQTRPGVRFWRTRFGYCYRVDAMGTHPLGRHTVDAFHAGAGADEAAHANRVDLDVVHHSDGVLAYHHTKPYWDVHIVVVPKRHVRSLTDTHGADEALLRELLQVVQDVARHVEAEHGAARVLTNLGAYQASKHLHVHVSSGDARPRSR